jgi:hypothetical protein
MHAVTNWKVDIVSMSFGLADENDDGCDELANAILKAHAAAVLIFAAASNSGMHSGPAFPARHSNVFCIYASDGMGNSGLTNPTAKTHDYNFSTLGHAVESAWPKVLSRYPTWTKRKSGTSFSTPIAAGIAAFILLYARQNMAQEEARRFKQFDKMRDVLYCLSDRRGDYNVISISGFFDNPLDFINATLRKILAGTWRR